MSRDHEYQAEKAAADAMKFVSDNNVFAIVGGIGSPTARRMAPILRRAKMPFVGIVSGADFLRDRKRFPNVVNLRSSYGEETRRLVSHMFNKLGARRFGVIYQDDAFGRSVLNSYHEALKALGLPILAKASYSWHSHSVHSSVFLLQKADLDVVMLATNHDERRGCDQHGADPRRHLCRGAAVHREYRSASGDRWTAPSNRRSSPG